MYAFEIHALIYAELEQKCRHTLCLPLQRWTEMNIAAQSHHLGPPAHHRLRHGLHRCHADARHPTCCSWWTGPRTLQSGAAGMDQMERTSPGGEPAAQTTSDTHNKHGTPGDETRWGLPTSTLSSCKATALACLVFDMGLAAVS